MDPTLAALLGAGIATFGTVLVPFATARHSRLARRRDVMQEAYAEGTRAMADFIRVRDLEGYAKLRERLFEAQILIRLVGEQQTSVKYDKFVVAMSGLIDVATEEVTKFRLQKPERRAGAVFPQAERDGMTAAYREFLIAARQDIGTDGQRRRKIGKAVKSA